MLAPQSYALEIPRGATWPAHGWVLMSPRPGPDGARAPLRTIPSGTQIAAKIRASAGAEEVLYTFQAELVSMVLEPYGPEPVIVALLGEIPHTVTATWTFERAVWDLLVDHRLVVPAAEVTAPWVVSR